MFASAAVIRALSSVGDSVLILQPVYYPFADVIKDNNRKLVVSELVLKDGKYAIDYEDLENQIIKNAKGRIVIQNVSRQHIERQAF